ncbi:Integrase, catalytic core protein [Phytophthora megakarya]|uniref:Integrase, catalytic core protein n=1 Tax=Phytophthora megakarya TaxID=4795 RepID=A0A225V438_9STRA|nr:Integrase, catalytic core protein [Phytophthora megakarya]
MKFRKLVNDQCDFVGNIDGSMCCILVCVDDLLIIAPTLSTISRIKAGLKKHFKMSDLGEAQYLLERIYATKVLNRFSHLNSHPVGTPTDPSIKLSLTMCPQTDVERDEMKAIPYREAVGSFMYTMMGTRPDLAYFLREVRQYLTNSRKQHWNAVKRGLRYPNGTRNLGITLGGRRNVEQYREKENITVFSDPDYAKCPDNDRPVRGYITYMCGNPISWQSRKHHTVVLSTTEPEYIALGHCTQEVIFLELLLLELNHDSPHAITIYEGNHSYIKLSYDPELIEKVVRKGFEIVHCNTKEMVADIFTKSLTNPNFFKLQGKHFKLQ